MCQALFGNQEIYVNKSNIGIRNVTTDKTVYVTCAITRDYPRGTKGAGKRNVWVHVSTFNSSDITRCSLAETSFHGIFINEIITSNFDQLL